MENSKYKTYVNHDFGKTLLISDKPVSIREYARLLDQSRMPIETFRVFNTLKMHGVLIKSGINEGFPAQKYMYSGLFAFSESGYWDNNGEWNVIWITCLTEKGQKYFFDEFFASMSA